jgi:hypothetical protein
MEHCPFFGSCPRLQVWGQIDRNLGYFIQTDRKFSRLVLYIIMIQPLTWTSLVCVWQMEDFIVGWVPCCKIGPGLCPISDQECTGNYILDRWFSYVASKFQAQHLMEWIENGGDLCSTIVWYLPQAPDFFHCFAAQMDY